MTRPAVGFPTTTSTLFILFHNSAPASLCAMGSTQARQSFRQCSSTKPITRIHYTALKFSKTRKSRAIMFSICRKKNIGISVLGKTCLFFNTSHAGIHRPILTRWYSLMLFWTQSENLAPTVSNLLQGRWVKVTWTGARCQPKSVPISDKVDYEVFSVSWIYNSNKVLIYLKNE